MALTVIGIFDDAQEAQNAVEKLTNAGFSRSDIDLSAQTGSGSTDSAVTTGSTFADEQRSTSDTHDEKESGIGHFFRSLFGDNDDDSSSYTRVANEGSVVTVHARTDDEAERAADILDDAGAIDVNERAAQYGYGSTGATTGAITGATTGVTTGAMTGVTTGTTNDVTAKLPADGDQTIKVIEENLEVGKRTVETGGVRLRSRIVSKPVEEHIRLREERVRVQRTPVNRPATAADLNAFQEGEISLTEHAEVPVVSKTASVVEEISVGKDVSERDETIRDTVRRTDVDVEQLGSTEQAGNTSRTTRSDDDVIGSTK